MIKTTASAERGRFASRGRRLVRLLEPSSLQEKQQPGIARLRLASIDLRPSLSTLGIALTSYILVLIFFAPQFVQWKGLYLPLAQSTPEVNRAVDVLKQLDDPFVQIQDANNSVIRWRLLFPIVAHYLHFPTVLFLAIPQIGCLVTLIYIAHLARQFMKTAASVFCTTALMATTSWFFVSTGWLCYDDSWVMLGLLLVSFASSRTLLIAACLLEPFIDERFVVAVPLLLAVRLIFIDPRDSLQRRHFVGDAAIIIALAAGYVILRLVSLRYDTTSVAYIARRPAEMVNRRLWRCYLLGGWMGMRLLWLPVGALLWLTFQRRKLFAGLFLALTVLISIGLAVVIASDISRSMCLILPASLLGLILMMRHIPRQMAYALPSLLAGNLLLPAANVVTVFTQPISSVYAVTQQYLHPPRFVNPAYYLQKGRSALDDNHLEDAEQMFTWSLQLDPGSTSALTYRSVVRARMHDLAGAAMDAKAALNSGR